MYPGVIVEYNDQSDVSQLPISEVRNKPLFLAVFTSDKGTEAWTRISGKDFFDMYGKSISFTKHGQPLLQTAMSINAGAELICKRLVAEDSTLANIGIIATLADTEVQAKDSDGNLLYKDGEGNETVEVTETPVMKAAKSVTYSIKSAENVKSVEDAADAIKKTLADGEYLLYTIADNGRGTSKKRIKIVPNYRLSKSLDYVLYTLHVIEGTNTDETMTFSVNPNLIVSNENISLQSMIRSHSTQLSCVEDISGMDSFVEALATAAGIESSEMYMYDPLFGCNNRGDSIDTIVVSNEGIDLQYNYGQMLESGSNGNFGDYPIQKTEEYAKAAVEAFDGTFDTVIYNVDQYKIDAIIDANYPPSVKRAIEYLATFREDLMYFRDQGLGQTSIELIEETCKGEAKNMFCATYPQSYDIIDPYSKRQVSVTIGYDLAQLIVNHINNGRSLPTAGMKYGMIVKNAIYGTLSFAPTPCPDPEGNQREKLEDMHVNYASYIDNQLVIETLYTSQDKPTQWSYINNVMGIQEVVKAIRSRCPAIRYTFIDGEDLEKYKAEVEEVIAPYSNNFKLLELEYVADATYSANKIFYAMLKVVYKDFIQTEWFKVIALSATEIES